MTNRKLRGVIARWPLWRAVVLSLCFVPGAFAATWRSFSTQEFDVVGDATLSDMRRTVADVETYRFVLQTLVPRLAKRSSVRPRLFILSHGSFRDYVQPGPNVLGLTSPRPFSIDVVVDANASDWISTTVILQHELTHYYLHQNFASVLPTWFDEGIAELFSTVDRKGAFATFGKPSVARWYALQSLPWMPLEKFIELDVDVDRKRSSDMDAFYAQAWLLMHYTYVAEPKRLADVQRVLEYQNQGLPAHEALRRSFPDNFEDFESKLRTYTSAQQYRYAKLPIPPLSSESAPVTELSKQQGLTEMALLMLRLGRDPKKIGALLADIGAAPQDDRVVAAAALQASRAGAAGAAALRAQCLADARSTEAVKVCGDAFIASPNNDADATPQLAEIKVEDVLRARELYERIVAQKPADHESLFTLCRTYMWAPEGAAQLIPRLERATADSPNETPLRRELARLYRMQNRLADAKSQIERIALTANNRDERAWSIRELQAIDTEIAARAAKR